MDITIPELGISVGIFATFVMAGESVCFCHCVQTDSGAHPTSCPRVASPLPLCTKGVDGRSCVLTLLHIIASVVFN